MEASLTQSITDFVIQGIDRWGYLLVFILVFLETSAFIGVFVPGETAVILSGVAAAQGALSLPPLIGVIVVAAIMGDTVGYVIGRQLGRDFILRHPRFFRVRPDQMDRVERFFKRHGGKTVFFSRWSAFFRVFSPLVAGSSRMSYPRFMAYNIAGALTWATVTASLGYLAGRSYHLVERWLGRISLFLVILVVLAVVLYIVGKRYLWPRREHLGRLVVGYGQAVLEWRPVRAFRRRFDTQIRWVGRRLSPNQAYGLLLTLGLAVSTLLVWAFAALLESVLTRDPLTLLDRQVAVFLSEHAVPAVTRVMVVVTWLGNAAVLIPAALLIGAVLLWRRRPGEALVLVTATVGAAALDAVVKILVNRPRPDFVVPLVKAGGLSFPSGHAATSIAFYLTLGLLAAGWVRSWENRVYVLLAALATILVVGFSRLYLGVHYLSDVLAGWALGALWTTVAVTVEGVWQQARGPSPSSLNTPEGIDCGNGQATGRTPVMTTQHQPLEELSREEIEAKIAEAEEELEDLAAERSLTLGGTGVHLGAKEAERLRNEFERDEARVEARLQELRGLLAEK